MKPWRSRDEEGEPARLEAAEHHRSREDHDPHRPTPSPSVVPLPGADRSKLVSTRCASGLDDRGQVEREAVEERDPIRDGLFDPHTK